MRVPDYFEWTSKLTPDAPFNAEVTVSSVEEPAFTKMIALTVNLKNVKVEITIIGSDSVEGSPETPTTVIKQTTTEDERIELSSSTKEIPPFIRMITLRFISLVEDQEDLAVRVNIEACIKQGGYYELICNLYFNTENCHGKCKNIYVLNVLHRNINDDPGHF